jgi:hypothetical protein
MARVTSDGSTHLRVVDPLDVDLLEALEERDRNLYAIMSAATRYRAILHEQVQLTPRRQASRSGAKYGDPLARDPRRDQEPRPQSVGRAPAPASSARGEIRSADVVLTG